MDAHYIFNSPQALRALIEGANQFGYTYVIATFITSQQGWIVCKMLANVKFG